jgi:hypothetical protein
MSSLNLDLELRSTVATEEGAEGIHSHAVVQLGIMTSDQGKNVSNLVTMSHKGYPPLYNVAIEAPSPPAWLDEFEVGYLTSLIPAVPGPGVYPFIPGPSWVTPTAAGVAAPLDPFTAAASAAANIPGGFLFFSNPGSIHLLQVTTSVIPGLPQNAYNYAFYLSGSFTPAGAPRHRFAKINVSLLVQRDTYEYTI